MRCKLAIGPSATWARNTSVVYMSEAIDPFQSMPLCYRCAILAAFRCGKAKA